MKQILSKYAYHYFVLSIAILFISTHAFAEGPTSTPTLNSGQAAQNQNEKAPTEKSNQNGLPSALSQKFQERIINLCQNITKRFTAGADRMTNIIARIETRIEKLKAQGIDTTIVTEKLSEAKSSLSITYTIISNFGSAEAMIGSDKPKEAFDAYRIHFNEARISLQNTYRLLLDTVALLKTASEKNVPNTNATNTPQVQ